MTGLFEIQNNIIKAIDVVTCANPSYASMGWDDATIAAKTLFEFPIDSLDFAEIIIETEALTDMRVPDIAASNPKITIGELAETILKYNKPGGE